MWIYPSEILPLKLRLRGGALAVVSQWLFTFLVVQITPPMITNINYRSYIVFAVINFFTIPCVYFFFVSHLVPDLSFFPFWLTVFSNSPRHSNFLSKPSI